MRKCLNSFSINQKYHHAILQNRFSAFILLFFIFLVPFLSYSQSPKGSCIIRGVVFTESSQPVAYANIILYKQQDSLPTAGTVTDSMGRFLIRGLQPVNYFLECKFMGFYRKVIPGIRLSPTKTVFVTDTIRLTPAVENLEAVEINSKRKVISYEIDKKVVRVGKDMVSPGETAVDILENVPSVQTDIKGNVILRGSSGFQLLIDGVPAALDPSKELKLIPAGSIREIEIITNPSAKYDPDGVGGIINIITKEKNNADFQGMVSASWETPKSYNSNITISVKTRKIKVFGDISYRSDNDKYLQRNEITRQIADTTLKRESDIEKHRFSRNLRVKTGMDFYLSGKSTLGFYGTYMRNNRDHDITDKTFEYINPSGTEKYLKQTHTDIYSQNYYILNIHYDHDLNAVKKQKLSFNFQSRFMDFVETNRLQIDTANSDWEITAASPGSLQTLENYDHSLFRLKADYTQKAGKNGKLETGYNYFYNGDKSVFKYEADDYDFHNGDLTADNHFFYSKTIHAVYGTYSNKIKNLGYKLGLRVENYKRITDQQTIQEKHTYDKFNFFPTLHLQYRFSKKHQVQASYSRRIFRLWGTYFNPNPDNRNSYTITIGNPELEPEYANAYELNYIFRFKNSFVSTEIYYRRTNNKIEHLQVPQPDNTLVYTYENMNKDHTLGMEYMLNLVPVKWYNLNTAINLYHYSILGDIIEDGEQREINTWYARVKNTFKLKRHISIEIKGRYSAPSITAQVKTSEYWIAGLSIKKECFERKLICSFNIQDLFYSGISKETIDKPGYYWYYETRNIYPLIYLGVTCKFGRNGE